MEQTAQKIAIKRKPTKIVSIVLALLLLTGSAFLLSKSVKEIIATVQLKQQLNSVKSDLKVLETRQGDLLQEKDKLENESYVQNYARGKHLLSKSEEQVFILPKGE